MAVAPWKRHPEVSNCLACILAMGRPCVVKSLCVPAASSVKWGQKWCWLHCVLCIIIMSHFSVGWKFRQKIKLDGSPAAQGSHAHLASAGGWAELEDPCRLHSALWSLCAPSCGLSATPWIFFHPRVSSEFLCSTAAGFPEQKLPDFLRFISGTGTESFPLQSIGERNSQGWPTFKGMGNRIYLL